MLYFQKKFIKITRNTRSLYEVKIKEDKDEEK